MKALFLLLSIVQATLAFQSCHSCAQRSGGRNYMCYEKGLFADPYQVSCCSSKNDKFCDVESDPELSCSKTYTTDQHAFYTYCPRVNGTSCGLDT